MKITKGLTYKNSRAPGIIKNISDHDFSDDASATGSSGDVKQVFASVKANCPDVAWAIHRKRQIFPIPSSGVQSNPTRCQTNEKIGDNWPWLSWYMFRHQKHGGFDGKFTLYLVDEKCEAISS